MWDWYKDVIPRIIPSNFSVILLTKVVLKSKKNLSLIALVVKEYLFWPRISFIRAVVTKKISCHVSFLVPDDCKDSLIPNRPDITSISFLSWTSTPWSLSLNHAIAISPKANYSLIQRSINSSEAYIVSSTMVPVIFRDVFKTTEESYSSWIFRKQLGWICSPCFTPTRRYWPNHSFTGKKSMERLLSH